MVAISLLLSSIAQDNSSLQEVWKTVNADSCPYHYNFHMHTTASDGRLTPIELIEQAFKIGLKGLAITDHHSVNGYQEVQEYLNQSRNRNKEGRPALWTGVEITSKILGVDVHILGYAFDPQNQALAPYLEGHCPRGEAANAEKVIDSIHQAGGLAVLAHPYRYRRSPQELIPLAAKYDIDGVEAYYAYGNPYPWQPTPRKTKEIVTLAEEYDLLTTCGTDTHGRCLLQRV